MQKIKSYSGKLVIAMMAILALILAISIYAFNTTLHNYTPTALNWSQKGIDFGQGKGQDQDETACLYEAHTNMLKCEDDKTCRAGQGIFYARCTENARPIAGRCVGVPDVKDKLATQQWREQFCSRFNLKGESCIELVGWTQKFCLVSSK